MGNTILLNGPLQISKPDTPPIKGSVVETMDDLMELENPHVGQAVYVRSERRTFYVRSLKAKDIGGLLIENAAVYEVSDVFADLHIDERVYYEKETETLHLF